MISSLGLEEEGHFLLVHIRGQNLGHKAQGHEKTHVEKESGKK